MRHGLGWLPGSPSNYARGGRGCAPHAGYDGHVRVVYPYVWLQLLPYSCAGVQSPYIVSYEDPDIFTVSFSEQYHLNQESGWVQWVS